MIYFDSDITNIPSLSDRLEMRMQNFKSRKAKYLEKIHDHVRAQEEVFVDIYEKRQEISCINFELENLDHATAEQLGSGLENPYIEQKIRLLESQVKDLERGIRFYKKRRKSTRFLFKDMSGMCEL